MEFNEKLQELRRRQGLTQEQLAERLYVSRTAVSKWESGRGYPSIDSLKAIARLFSVTVDEMLSSEELISVAEEQQKQREGRMLDVVFGLADVSASLLLFLPLFAARAGETLQEASLLSLVGVPLYVRVVYLAFVISTSLLGLLTLALQGCRAAAWMKVKRPLSLALGVISVLLFVVGRHPYASAFAFTLLIIKGALLLRRT